MGRTFDRGLVIGIALMTALIVLNAVLGYRNTVQLDKDAGWVAHTHEVLDLTGDVLLALVDAETGERGFLLTGREEYLIPYDDALPRLDERMARLKELTQANAWQQEHIQKLEKLAADRLALLEQRIERRRKRERDPDAFDAAKNGKQQMDAIRALVAEMERNEHDQLRGREQRTVLAYQVAVTTGLLTAFLGLVTVGGFVWMLRRSLGARAQAAALLNEQREWLSVTLASIGDAVIATDVESRIVLLNPVAQFLTGWTLPEAAGRHLETVFHIINEQTRQPVASPVARALRDGTVVGLANHTILVARDGTERPIDDSAAPIRDGQGNCVGVVLVFRDVTERRRAEDARRHLAAIVESSDDAIIGKTLDGIITSWNQGAERLYGYSAAEAIGKPVSLLLPPGRTDELEVILDRIRQGEVTDHIEMVRRRKDATLIDVSVNISPIKNARGEVTGASAIARDITRQKRAQRDALFLADASAALAGLVDYESTLQKVARLAVSSFADWVTVDMLEADQTLRRVAVAHANPAMVELARDLHRRYPPDPNAPQGIWQIIRTGQAEIVSSISDDLLTQAVQDPERLRILQELGLRSYLGVPLVARDQVLGVMTFLAAESGRRYDATDLAVAEDLAHRAAVAVENARLYQEVRAADRRKDEFLAMLAHELRNPLAPLRTALHILKLPEADAAVAGRAREMMERQVEQLVRLVDDLLDVSRIMSGKIELRRQPVELATVVVRAVEISQPVIDADGHALTVFLTPEPLRLDGDLVRLAQVVSNLLNNAAKYTERGGTIRLTGERQGGQAVLRVRDNGIGIPPDMLDRVFDMFVQAERRMKNAQAGMGIGLTLVKRLVEMHGGSVEAHSEGPGKGSEFVVRLPLLTESGSQHVAAEKPQPKAVRASTPRRVLIVDDNVDAADSLAMLLRLEGHHVTVAHDGLAALERAAAEPPRVALLDIGMPTMDGYELARRFRASPALEQVLLVALTGWGQEEDRRRTREAGFDHHLVKPVAVETLRELLARAGVAGRGEP